MPLKTEKPTGANCRQFPNLTMMEKFHESNYISKQ